MEIVQIVIQAGSVGVAIYAIYVLSTLVGNHIDHSTQALTHLGDVIEDLKTWLQSNK